MIEQEMHDDGVVTLTLAHGKANVIDLEALEALSAALADHAEADAVVLTGRGHIFSAGVDLKRLTGEGPAYAERFAPLLDRVLRELFAFPAPLVVAVNGHAIAGGCIYTLCGDYRLMAEGRGRIGAPELRVSVPFPSAPLEILRYALPRRELQRHIYSGETLPPDEALQRGFVDELAAPESLQARAQELARDLAAIPRKHFRLTKRMLREEALARMDRGQSMHNPEVFARWAADDTLDGIRTYLASL